MDKKAISLFIRTFAATFLLMMGLGFFVLPVIPTIASYFSAQAARPFLPLAEDRTEGFLEIGENAGKRLYPPLAETPAAETGDWLRIPAIEVNVPLVLSASIEDADVIKALNSGVALYPNGIVPGRLGNAFIAAHSTGNPWQGPYRFAFYRVNQIKPGNVIHVDYQGTRYTYTVKASEIVKPTPDYRIVSDRPVPTITLMACWPLWSTSHRMLISGELTNITQLTKQRSKPASQKRQVLAYSTHA